MRNVPQLTGHWTIFLCRTKVAEGRGVDTRLQIVGAMLLIGGWRGWSEPDWALTHF